MLINNYGNTTVTNWEVDNNGNKVSVEVLNETQQVVGNKLVLNGLPDEQYRVSIDGFVEINIREPIIATNQFKVDYKKYGVVFFHPDQDGQWININRYYSKGLVYIPAGRIWTKVDNFGYVTETLAGILEDVQNVNDDLQAVFDIINNAATVEANFAADIAAAQQLQISLGVAAGEAEDAGQILNQIIAHAIDTHNLLNTKLTEVMGVLADIDLDELIARVGALEIDQHEHANKMVLDKLTELEGVLQYDGKNLGDAIGGFTWGSLL